MSKKKTDMEMLKGLIGQYITAHPEGAEEIEEIIEELDPCINCEVHYCNDCPNWHDSDDKAETEDDRDDEEDEDEEEDEEDEYYRYPECECVDGECDQCDYWVNKDYCKLDDIYENCEGHEICGCSDEDCYSCKGSKEHKQIEELSKFIMSVGTVLGGDMGLLVFDKSNKKDMEKLAAIFGEYAKRLS